MRSVFTDTSAFMALFYEEDQNHGKAKEYLDRLRKNTFSLVTTDYIFDETVTGIMSSAGQRAAVAAGDFILNSGMIKVVWLDESIKARAWNYFKKYDDKNYSFTDCTSFILMKEMNITGYFAFDDHFKQAGFVKFS